MTLARGMRTLIVAGPMRHWFVRMAVSGMATGELNSQDGDASLAAAKPFQIGRTTGRTVVVSVWATVAALMAIGGVAIAFLPGSWWVGLLIVVLATPLGTVAFLVGRCGITADRNGIDVTNIAARRHIDWPDLMAMEVQPVENALGLTLWYQLRLHTSHRATTSMIPIGTLQEGRPLHVTATRLAEMRETYAGPFPNAYETQVSG